MNNGSLQNFIAVVKTEGLMRSSRYAVSMRLPKSIPNNPDMRKILLFCSDITIPGVTIATNQLRIHGEVREAPNEKIFDNANMTFYVDNNMEVKDFFDSWVESIQHPVTRNFNYYDQYTTEIMIDVEDLTDRKRYQIIMYEAYPKNVGQIQVGYDQKEVMKLSVSMNYKYWVSRLYAAPEETKESPWNNYTQVNNNVVEMTNIQQSVLVPDSYIDNFNDFQTEFNYEDTLDYNGRV